MELQSGIKAIAVNLDMMLPPDYFITLLDDSQLEISFWKDQRHTIVIQENQRDGMFYWWWSRDDNMALMFSLAARDMLDYQWVCAKIYDVFEGKDAA